MAEVHMPGQWYRQGPGRAVACLQLLSAWHLLMRILTLVFRHESEQSVPD